MLQPSPSPQDGNQGIVDRAMAPSATARPASGRVLARVRGRGAAAAVGVDGVTPAELGLERPQCEGCSGTAMGLGVESSFLNRLR